MRTQKFQLVLLPDYVVGSYLLEANIILHLADKKSDVSIVVVQIASHLNYCKEIFFIHEEVLKIQLYFIESWRPNFSRFLV